MLTTPRRTFVAAAALLVAAWAFVAFLPQLQVWLYGDVRFYETWGGWLTGHRVPYRDFRIEYPPGALPAFMLPIYLRKAFGYHETYYFWFRVEILAIALLTLFATARALAHLGASRRHLFAALAFTAVAPALLGPIALARYDYWPALFAVAGIAALLGGRPVLACLAFAAGAVAKVFPIVLIPFALFELWRRDGARGVVRGLAAVFALFAVAIVPFAVVAPHGFWWAIHRQIARPLQVESLGAAVFVAAHQIGGLHLHVVKSAGSDNLVGPGPSTAASASGIATVLALLAIYALYLRSSRGKEQLVTACVAAVVAYVTLSKVFSPQYLVWLFPLVPLVGGSRGIRASALLAVAIAMTQIWEPYHYADYARVFTPWVSWLVVVRDLVVVALLGVLVWPLRLRAVPSVRERERVREPRADPAGDDEAEHVARHLSTKAERAASGDRGKTVAGAVPQGESELPLSRRAGLRRIRPSLRLAWIASGKRRQFAAGVTFKVLIATVRDRLLASLVACAIAGVGVLGVVVSAESASPVPSDERSQISAAFVGFFAPQVTGTRARRLVAGADGRLAASLRAAAADYLSGFTQGQARLSAHIRSISASAPGAARVAFSIDVGYRGGAYRQLYTGAAVRTGGRWRVGWATACFVAETHHALCPQPPRSAAILPTPGVQLPQRFRQPADVGLVRPQSLAVAPNGDLLIADIGRDQVFRLHAGHLQVLGGTARPAFASPSGVAVAADGTVDVSEATAGRIVAIAPSGAITTVASGLRQPMGLAPARDGSLFVATASAVVRVGRGGTVTTFARGRGKSDQIVIGGRRYAAFTPESLALDGAGDLYASSFGTKTVFEFAPNGTPIRAWQSYANALASAPDGSVVVAGHGGALQRIRHGRLLLLLDFTKKTLLGSGGVFEPEGLAVAPSGAIFVDTFAGDGWTNQTALATISPGGRVTLLRTATPIEETLPPPGASGFPVAEYPSPRRARAGNDLAACPNPQGLRAFDARARASAVNAAEAVDTEFWLGLRLSDRAWWSGLYTDWIDGLYEGGRHAAVRGGAAVADVYAPAVARACGVNLVRRSLAVVIGRSPYSSQISHLYFIDRRGHALLYWQHT